VSISVKARKMLWGRSASRCSYPECHRQLVEDETETDDPSIVGDEAHIVAEEPDGPRGDSPLTRAERDSYSNLMLLCKVHHKLVDDQPNEYTVKALLKMKQEHLDWVAQNLDIDRVHQRDDEVYAGYVDEWAKLASLDDWDGWTSHLLGSGQPGMSATQRDQLYELQRYLLSRDWPGRYPVLDKSFHNFAAVLNDFRVVFAKYARPRPYWDDYIETEKFYRRGYESDGSANRLSEKYSFHVDLVEDLVLELTRAANEVCRQVRVCLSPSFRLHEGLLLVTTGPDYDLSFTTYRTVYRADEVYRGLRDFMEARASRDLRFGEGVDESYIPSRP